jgi:hypothetical protein
MDLEGANMPTFKMILGIGAIIVFGWHAYRKKDLESLGWAILVIMWAMP